MDFLTFGEFWSDGLNSSKDESTIKRNPRGKPVSRGQKQIIINYYKSVLESNQKMKFKEMLKHISQYIGIGYNTVRLTISEYRNMKRVSSPNRTRQRLGVVDKIDDFSKNAIRRKVHSFWFNKELPTISKILRVINEDETLPDIKETSLRKVLKSLNFTYCKRKKNSILIERNDIISWRRKYLTSICRFREEGRPIYYLDETWLNTEDCTTNPTGKGKRLIILHIGSVEGFVHGGLLYFESQKITSDYHNDINGQVFKEWFEKILPLLKNNAVVVMDNASYHSMKKEQIPTMSWKKADILDWLSSKGEEADPTTMVKVDLMQIVKRLKPKFSTYVIDEIAEEAGKLILRLPPYHCELNPIEMVWSMVKQYVKSNNTTCKKDDLKHLIHQALDRVNSEDWENFISHVKEEEKRFWDVDFICDEVLEDLQTNGDTSDSSEDEDDDVGCYSLD